MHGPRGPHRRAGERRAISEQGAVKIRQLIVQGVPSCLETRCDCLSCPPYNTHVKPGHCGVCAHTCHKKCGPIAALRRKLRRVK